MSGNALLGLGAAVVIGGLFLLAFTTEPCTHCGVLNRRDRTTCRNCDRRL